MGARIQLNALIIFILAGGPIILFTLRYLSLRRIKQFVKSAVSVTGRITTVEQTTVTARHVPVWVTTVSFPTREGQQIEFKSYNDCSQGQSGDTVKVLYLLTTPQDAKIDDKSLWTDGQANMIIGIVWIDYRTLLV